MQHSYKLIWKMKKKEFYRFLIIQIFFLVIFTYKQ